MKNEVKLNIHMFFPEMQNDEISSEKHAALEKLLNLSPVDAEDSVEKFIAELESRFELIKPILGDQTEEFLGYCQNDITKLSDFFDGKFVRFGMDAVAVQKILRNIWLQTPCEDKRLNYNLYKYIDEKFYAIVNERKRNISFDHIPVPTDSQWETLKNDWESRRAHYAACLDIDIDYLDGEAVDGTIFPSASGLFANPEFSPNYDFGPLRELEFLNYWFPHLLSDKMLIIPKYLTSEDIYGFMLLCQNDWFEIYAEFFRLRITNFTIVNDNNRIKIRQREKNKLTAEEQIKSVLLNDTNYAKYNNEIYRVEHEWYEKIRGYYGFVQPSNFFSTTPFTTDELPAFTNPYHEYKISDNGIEKSKYVRFHNLQKIYFPDNISSSEWLVNVASAFGAVKFSIPDLDANENVADFAQTLYNYYRIYYTQYCVEKTGIRKNNGIIQFPPIFNFRACELKKSIADLAQVVMNDNKLTDLIKREVVTKIKSAFNDVLGELLNDFLTDFIESDDSVPDPECFTLAQEIKYFYERNQFEKTQKELELQLREVETRIDERKENFKAINHDIKNMIRAIKGFMDRSDFTQANQGLAIITDIVDAVNASFRELPNEWKEDLSSQESDKSLKDILNDAFLYCIPNMFCYGYEKIYETETLNYFEWAEDADKARLEWNELTDPEEKLNWVKCNMFELEWEDNADTENIKIGNRHYIATHFFIMFNEIFLNAIKAISYVDDHKKRCMTVKLSRKDNSLIVAICNTATNDNKKYQKGLGFGNHLIIDNYIDLFKINDFSTAYDNKHHIYEVNFSIPVMK